MMTKIFSYFKKILTIILFDHSKPTVQAVKYKEIIVPLNEEELNTKIIHPSVLIVLRMNHIRVWLNEAKKNYNEAEARKKGSGYSLEASKAIATLSYLKKNIEILTAELESLEARHLQLSQNYKAYLKLLELPSNVPPTQSSV